MENDVRLHSLAGRYGTPLYVLDLDAVLRQLAVLRAAFPSATFRYAVKANANRHLLAWLAAQGVGCEVITEGELVRAVTAGVPGSSILVGGPGQRAAMRSRAREVGVGHVSLDGPEQWAAWADALPPNLRFFVRVNPSLDPATHPHLSTGSASAKFGVPPREALALARAVVAAGRFAGFHVHVGSMIPDASAYGGIVAILDALMDAVPEAQDVNLGGGFGVPSFDFGALAELLNPWLAARGARLMLEPGRVLVADAGILLTRVLWRKDPGEDVPGARTHWICDAGMAQLLRPALYGAEHPIRVVGAASGAVGTGDVDGPLCENADRLGSDRTLAAAAGDLLAVESAGAYGLAMASNYASDVLPAEVVLAGGVVVGHRPRQSVEALLDLERGPQ